MAAFEQEHEALLSNLSPSDRATLLANLEAEATRRRSQPAEAAKRKARISAEYTPRHPELWALSEDFLHPDFVRLVKYQRGDGAASPCSW